MIILVDMDGVLSDLEHALHAQMCIDYPEIPQVQLDDRKSFYLDDEYPQIDKDYFWNVMQRSGTFRNLPLIEGAQQGIQRLLDDGFVVKICTTPVVSAHCIREKLEWINEHFPALRKDVITTNDKTIIYGDYLIDDKEPIKGFIKPFWKHIQFKSGQRNSGTFEWTNMEPLYADIDSGEVRV